jgi:hypothetical protein
MRRFLALVGARERFFEFILNSLLDNGLRPNIGAIPGSAGALARTLLKGGALPATRRPGNESWAAKGGDEPA